MERSTSTQTGEAKRQRRPVTTARGVLAAGSGTSIGGLGGQVWQDRYSKLCDRADKNIEDAVVLPTADPASQAPEIDQYAGAPQRRNQTHALRGAHLCPSGQLPESSPHFSNPSVARHENWIEATRNLNMDFLKGHKKEALRRTATCEPGRLAKVCAY